MHRMLIYIAGREWSSKCWLPGPIGDPGEEFEVMAPRPGDQEVTTAALAVVITGNLLVLRLLVRNLPVMHLLVRILLVLHLLVRILLVLTTTAGIGLRCNLSRKRSQLEAVSTTRRPPRLNRRAAAARGSVSVMTRSNRRRSKGGSPANEVIELNSNLSRSRTRQESNSAGVTPRQLSATVARRPPRLTLKAAATR